MNTTKHTRPPHRAKPLLAIAGEGSRHVLQ